MPTGRKMKHVTIIEPNFHHQSFTDDKKTGLINAALPLVGSKKVSFDAFLRKLVCKKVVSFPQNFRGKHTTK